MKIRDLFKRKDSSIKEGQYKFRKDIRPPPPIKKPTISLVADLMPLKNKIDSLYFMMQFGSELLKPLILLKCGCVGYFYNNRGIYTFKYLGICWKHEINEYILDHRSIYKYHDHYAQDEGY